MSSGSPPARAAVAAALSAAPDEVQAALQRLHDARVVVLQPESGEILMANPFSAVPTPFPVRTAQQSYYGNCIWDALGVAAMLGTDAHIATGCGCCGLALQVDIRDGEAQAPPSIIHFALPAVRWWENIVFT